MQFFMLIAGNPAAKYYAAINDGERMNIKDQILCKIKLIKKVPMPKVLVPFCLFCVYCLFWNCSIWERDFPSSVLEFWGYCIVWASEREFTKCFHAISFTFATVGIGFMHHMYMQFWNKIDSAETMQCAYVFSYS